MGEEYPKAGELYRHFKGRMYQVLAVATHSETREKQVVYQALYGDYSVFVRPLKSFMGEIDPKRFPDATQKKRFLRIEKEDIAVKRTVKKAAEPTQTAEEPKAAEPVRAAEAAPIDIPHVERFCFDEGKDETTEICPEPQPTQPEASQAFAPDSIQPVAPQQPATMEKAQPQPPKKEVPEGVNPDLFEFLEAETSEEKLKVLLDMRERLDSRLMNSIEASLDVPGSDGSLEERIGYVTSHLRAQARYENSRLRH